MIFLRRLIIVFLFLVDIAEAVPSITISLDTTVSGVWPSYWNVTLVDVDVQPNFFRDFYWSSSKSVFKEHPSSTPDISIAECICSFSYMGPSTLSISIPGDCSFSGTVSFIIPGDYLAVNPWGNVSVMLRFADYKLRTILAFTPDSPSPSRSPLVSRSPSRSPSPSPTTPSPSLSPDPSHSVTPSPASKSPSPDPSPSPSPSPSPATASPSFSPVTASPSASPSASPPPKLLTIVPTTIDSGAQALYWNVTVFNIDQVAPDDSYYSNFYFTTSKTVFLEYPASAPKIVVAGCSASCYSLSGTTLYFSFARDCGYGGTFSFILPGDFLDVNPGGSTWVRLYIGKNTLRTAIPYTESSPSPSQSPPASPSASPSPSPSPASRSHSPSPRPSRSATPSPASRSPRRSPSPSRRPSPSPVSASPSPSPVSSSPSPPPWGLTVIPDTYQSGGMASSWMVVVENAVPVDPTSGSNYLSFDTNKTTFSTEMGWFPDLDVGGCSAKCNYFYRGTYISFSLNSDCAVGGTFSFVVPGDYLSANPGGAVSVTLTLGSERLDSVILYTEDSPSPSRSPPRSPRPSGSPIPSPSPDSSPSPSDSASPVSTSSSASPFRSPSPDGDGSFSLSAGPGSSPAVNSSPKANPGTGASPPVDHSENASPAPPTPSPSPPASNKSEDTAKDALLLVIMVAGAVCLLLLLVFMVAALVYWYCRHKKPTWGKRYHTAKSTDIFPPAAAEAEMWDASAYFANCLTVGLPKVPSHAAARPGSPPPSVA